MSLLPICRAQDLIADLGAMVLLDCRPDPGAYAEGHLPGAWHAGLNAILSSAQTPGFDPAQGGRHPLPDPEAFCRQLGAWGISPETSVLAYDDAAGGNGAARCWWMLRALGHREVRVLEGGLQAALAVGIPLSKESPAPVPAQDYPSRVWGLPTVDLSTVERLRQDPAWKLIDVRATERWRGEVEPFDPIPGRIPGSLNLPFAQNLTPEGAFKADADLRSHFLEALAGTPPERVIVHCGSGVTACHTLLALELAGLGGASLYVGSYSEWCRNGKPLR